MRRLELGERWWQIGFGFGDHGDLVQVAWGKTGGLEQRHDRTLGGREAAIA